MPKYKVSWAEELWFECWVEADSESEARTKVRMGEVPANLEPFGGEVQDGIDIIEIIGKEEG